MSLRDVSELLLARGIEVSHEAIRLWTVRFGRQRGWLWRAVDDGGEVLDIFVQRRRSARAAARFFRKPLKDSG